LNHFTAPVAIFNAFTNRFIRASPTERVNEVKEELSTSDSANYHWRERGLKLLLDDPAALL
jgi:hypothetical protein